TVVPVSAGTPPSGKVFDRWVLVGSGTIADATAFETTFTMASANATLEAMYEDGGGNDNTGGNTGGNDGGNAGNSAGNNPANGTDTENNNATGTNMNNDVANAATGANDKENAQVINEPETPTTQGPSAQQGTQTEGGEAPEPSGFPWVMLIALSVAAVLATGGTLVFLRRRRNQQESH
ncbi:MAG: hypothetical protein LBI64_08825, partial [Coriobacteriales bacterium]|nr:hypothetical protein [Coriobacteriales bacterium]